MLRANVGLSRKISRDFNSTGYSVSLDGEIPFPVDDPEAVAEKIKELFSLAQEALALEIARDQGESSLGRKDEQRPTSMSPPSGSGNGPSEKPSPGPARPSAPIHGNQNVPNGQAEPATNKQVQFLLTMGKRLKLSSALLEGRVAEIIGRRCGVYDLTKKEAGLVLDQLTKAADAANGGRSGR